MTIKGNPCVRCAGVRQDLSACFTSGCRAALVRLDREERTTRRLEAERRRRATIEAKQEVVH